MVTRYNRADYVCIDAPEAQLATGDRFSDIEDVITDGLAHSIDCDRFVVTHGQHGCVTYDRSQAPRRVPAFTQQVVDTVGAGDAFLSVTSPVVAAGADMEVAGFIGNAVGALEGWHRRPPAIGRKSTCSEIRHNPFEVGPSCALISRNKLFPRTSRPWGRWTNAWSPRMRLANVLTLRRSWPLRWSGAQAAHDADNKLMFIGNGGSSTIASHMAEDYTKAGGIRTLAFNDPAFLTCLGNDLGFDQVFAKQIEMFAQPGDMLVAISSSGNSQNILNAVSGSQEARAAG